MVRRHAETDSTEQRVADMSVVINQLLGVRWKALVMEDENLLDSAYSANAAKLLNMEKVKLVKHFMVPMRTSGYKYTGHTSSVKIESIIQTSDTVRAEVLETRTLTWGPEGAREQNSSQGSTRHKLTLVREAGRWVISSDEYDDEYYYLKNLEHPEKELPLLHEQLDSLKARPPKL